VGVDPEIVVAAMVIVMLPWRTRCVRRPYGRPTGHGRA